MYKVFCDGYTLHDPSLNDVHFQLISPVVTQEVNKAGSFTFTISAAHANTNVLRRLLSSVEVYDDSKLIFRGRILNDTRDWDDSRKVVCESDIAVLNDTTQRPYTFTGTVAAYISQLIGTHNTMAPADKQFTVGTVNVSGSVSIEQTGYSSTWHELEEKVLNQFSGYLFVTWTGSANRIDFLADSPYHCEQKISFGENLLDITRESKGENIITALIPLGAKVESTGEPLTIKSVNGGINYITNASAVAAYGLIFGTETWDTVTNAAELLARGQARLAELSQGVTTITLTAADLHLLDNEISSFDFLSYVTVEDLAHGVNGTMLVTKKTTNLTDPAQGKLTIGRESSGISKYYAETSDQIQTIRQTYATQEQVDTVNTTLQSEIQTQADKIALVVSESAGSYVIKSAEIVAAINESGSTVKISADHIALTGALIVSMINEGSTTINGNKITTGTLNASAIGAGKLTVYDNSSAILFEADKDTNTVQIAGFTVKNNSLEYTLSTPSGSGALASYENTSIVHVGTDNLNVFRREYELSDGGAPFPSAYSATLGFNDNNNFVTQLLVQDDHSSDPDDRYYARGTYDSDQVTLENWTKRSGGTRNGVMNLNLNELAFEEETGRYRYGKYFRDEWEVGSGTGNAKIYGNTNGVYSTNQIYTTRLMPSGIQFDGPAASSLPTLTVMQSVHTEASTETIDLLNGVYLAIVSHNNNSASGEQGLYLIQCRTSGNSVVRTIASANNTTLSISGGTLTWATTNTYRTLTLIRMSA